MQQYSLMIIVLLYLQCVDAAIFRSVSEWRKWKIIDILQMAEDIVMIFSHLSPQ